MRERRLPSPKLGHLVGSDEFADRRAVYRKNEERRLVTTLDTQFDAVLQKSPNKRAGALGPSRQVG